MTLPSVCRASTAWEALLSDSMGNPFILYSDEEKSPAASRCPYGGHGQHGSDHPRISSSQASDLPLRHSAARQSANSSR